MIILRKNAFSDASMEIESIVNETILESVKRTLAIAGYSEDERILEMFQVLINGEKLDRELWEMVVVKEGDRILIAPELKRGEGAQTLKTIALIAAAVVLAPTIIGAAGATGIGAAAINAGVLIGSGLILNALIPPPEVNQSGTKGPKDAQMYSITSQQNGFNKWGYVPKVYGRHRMFPTIAATPYTEIEADPETKELVQVYYAIYDFGLGPATVDTIRIGNTPIGEFQDADFRLVDLNKPAVDEGIWDEVLEDDFEFYKGDVERVNVGIPLNGNQEDGDPVEEWQLIRFASEPGEDVKQEITLDFALPSGLIAYRSDGGAVTRLIELKVQFSKADEDVWRNFNDLGYVSKFKTTGGATGSDLNLLRDKDFNLSPFDTDNYTILSVEFAGWNVYDGGTAMELVTFGLKKGATYIDAPSGQAAVNNFLTFNDKVLGQIVSISASPIPGASRYNLLSPLKKSHQLYIWSREANLSGGPPGPYVELLNNWYTPTGVPMRVKISSSGQFNLSGKQTGQKYATIKFSPREFSDYKVRVTRIRSSSSSNKSVQDGLVWSAITTRFDRKPILTEKRHLFLELRIRATNQLNGSIQDLSGEVSSVLDVYDPDTETWSKQISGNPAWVFADLLTGIINTRALDKSRLDVDSLVEWAEFCDELPTAPPSQTFNSSRFISNFVLDYDATLQTVLDSVSNSAQASLNIVDGKYGVLLDKLRTTPVQIFTPRNSWGFSSSRNYTDQPHAIRVSYVDPFSKWDQNEVIVYADGYDINTALPDKIQELKTFGCTNSEQAWRYGRYMLAQAVLRQENISINTDFEYLVCTRGDYVQITQDVMKVGGRPARVKTVSGNQITIDDALDTIPVGYGYTFRNPTSGIYTSTLTVINSDTFDLDGTMPAVGDLIIIGPVGSITFDCIVKAIIPQDDLTATITLVEKADAIYDAESTDTLPAYSPNLNLNTDTDLAAPPAIEDFIVTDNDWRVVGNTYQHYIGLDWELPTGAAFETFEIYVDSGKGYNLIDYTQESFYEYIVNNENLGIEHFFKVLAVSSTGKKIPLIEAPIVSATPLRKTTPPSDVTALYINITNQVIELTWPSVSDEDVFEYTLRYNPVSDDSQIWDNTIPLIRVSGRNTSVSVQGRTGTYFIKAVDLNGNESANVALAVTSIPNLFDLNVVEETNDFPTLPGVLDTVEFDGSGLVLRRVVAGPPEDNEFYPEGFYYYEQLLDLGDIYTVRFQSLIQAQGYTVSDLMVNWLTLDSVPFLSQAGGSDWAVETQLRATDATNTMAEWTTLDAVTTLTEGINTNWSTWRTFTIGDFTGRVFQFRLRLVSNTLSVSPRVFDGVIRADMPDRTLVLNNLTSSVMGSHVTFDPEFYGPSPAPNIQITVDDAQSGDYYLITGKALDGFDITFYDSTNTPVVRQYDVGVTGYGYKATEII